MLLEHSPILILGLSVIDLLLIIVAYCGVGIIKCEVVFIECYYSPGIGLVELT